MRGAQVNAALLAEHGADIAALAEQNDVALNFEAAASFTVWLLARALGIEGVHRESRAEGLRREGLVEARRRAVDDERAQPHAPLVARRRRDRLVVNRVGTVLAFTSTQQLPKPIQSPTTAVPIPTPST